MPIPGMYDAKCTSGCGSGGETTVPFETARLI